METVSCNEAVRRAIAHLGNKYSVQLLLPRILSTTQASVQIDLIVVTHGREVKSEPADRKRPSRCVSD